MKRLWQIIAGILSELSDEAAYQRYLAHHQANHSAAEWRKFHQQRLIEKYARAKCC